MSHQEDLDKNPWKVNSEKIIYENKWISLTEYDVINPSGNPGIYGKVHYKNIAVGVVPLDEENNTFLVGQYRFTLNEYSWEMPEGGCPIGEETVLETAKRELLEETGLIAEEWNEIAKLHLSNSVSDEVAFVFIARNLSQHSANPEETEDLKVWKLPFDEAFEMVMQSKITDAFTVAAFLKVKILLDSANSKDLFQKIS